MTSLTAAQQALVDTHPQQTDLFLSIYEPQIALQVRVTGTYDSTNQTVDFYSIITGSANNVVDYLFQMAEIGSERTWVRGVTGSSIRFVESDHISWPGVGTNYVITIYKYGEIIPIFPRIIQSPPASGNVIFYKMWDIPYTNQNTNLGSFICMGGHYAGFVGDPVYYSADGTYGADSGEPNFAWEFEGASIASSADKIPGYVSYSTPGHYRTILITTTDAGAEDKSVRYISIYDRPGQGSKTPYKSFEITNWSGSRDSYGYSTRIKLFEAIDRNKIKDGALIVIFGDDYYDNQKASIGGNATNRSSIKLVGYVDGETIQYDYDAGYVEFEIVSPTGIMQKTECYSVSVESKVTPTTWYELKNMNCSKALYHYYHWHSTVLINCDFKFEANDKYIQYFDTDRENLHSAGNTLMEGTLKGALVSDSQGKLWCETDVSVQDNIIAIMPTALSITKRDWIDQPTIEMRYYNEVSFLEMGGIWFVPATAVSTALMCGCPGSSSAYFGKVERIQGLALDDQADLNSIAGNLFAFKNSHYPNVEYKLRSSYWNLDIAPQEQIKITMSADESPLNVTWASKSFAIRSVDRSYIEKTIIPRVGLVEMTQGVGATTIVIPVIPPLTNSGGGTYTSKPPIKQGGIPPSVFSIYDEHIYIGNAKSMDFVGPLVQATMTGTLATITVSITTGSLAGLFPTGTTLGDVGLSFPVYHNSIFVGNAQALNFVDNTGTV
jgi:hypothetical protein